MNFTGQNYELFKLKYPDLDIFKDTVAKLRPQKVLSKSGMPTLKIHVEGKEFFVHSSYNPLREAQQWAERVAIGKDNVYFVFGFGLGYEVLELANRLSKDCKILVVEAHNEFIRLALESLDFTALLQRDNIQFLVGDQDFPVERMLVSYVGFDNIDKIQFIDYTPATKFDQAYYESIKKKITQGISNVIIEMNTMLRFAEEWLENLFCNLPKAIKSPGVARLYGEFASQPAIIVAAGPSLNKNIHCLKEAKGKSVIISVGTALRPLLQAGIKPDLVLSIDGGAANNRHFEDVAVEDIPLVFDLTIYPEIPKNYKGPKLVGGCHENLLRWVEKTLNEPKGLYDLGPSVANVAFGLAKNFGCNPIILVGQDLAYTDNKSHAQGTAYEYMTIEDYRGRDIIEVEGVDGHPVLTDRVMFAFLRKFEMTIAASRETHTVIDATEGGAKIPGTYIMPLNEAIKKYCQPLIDADNKISGIVDSYTPPDQNQLVKIIKEIKNLHNRLNVLSTEAKQGVLVSQKLQKLYRSGLPGPTELHKILKKLNEIDGRIGDLRETTELFVLMFQKGILNVKQKTNSKIDGESEIEKGRRVADNSVELYKGIKESADRAGRMVGKAVSELEILFDLRGVD